MKRKAYLINSRHHFDDFTTATQYVNFKFKVKSSAMKILNINTELVIAEIHFYRMQDHSIRS